jgi:hypothetical protein
MCNQYCLRVFRENLCQIQISIWDFEQMFPIEYIQCIDRSILSVVFEWFFISKSRYSITLFAFVDEGRKSTVAPPSPVGRGWGGELVRGLDSNSENQSVCCFSILPNLTFNKWRYISFLWPDFTIAFGEINSYVFRSFSVAAPKLWDTRPASIRSSPSLTTFKSKLKTHLFKSVFN